MTGWTNCETGEFKMWLDHTKEGKSLQKELLGRAVESMGIGESVNHVWDSREEATRSALAHFLKNYWYLNRPYHHLKSSEIGFAPVAKINFQEIASYIIKENNDYFRKKLNEADLITVLETASLFNDTDEEGNNYNTELKSLINWELW